MSTKKEQHYIPQKYLKAWNNPSIFWLHNGKIESRNVKSIAREKYFYEFKPCTQAEIEFVKAIYVDDAKIKAIKEFAEDWLKFCTTISNYNYFYIILNDRLTEMIKVHGDIGGFNVKQTLSETAKEIKKFNANTIEDEYSELENEAEIRVLSKLRRGDAGVLEDKKLKWLLHRYIWSQFFRTNNIKELILPTLRESGKNLLEQFPEAKPINMDLIYMLLIPIFAFNAAYMKSGNATYLLINNTSLPFITGDQPVINLAYEERDERGFVKDVEDIYFPISPRYAIIIATKDINKLFSNTNNLSLEEVKKLNDTIAKLSFEQLYASSKEVLKAYIV
ncbi:MAG: DUF4238 domain-containing protein [Firmicutes bacterium]|nr:DUF4238 domain-containing protein [Bacillota bacterium]